MSSPDEHRRRCALDCARLCHDFAHAVDHFDDAACAALFAADGVFERAGQESRGHAAIRAFLAARPRGRTTRHLCTGVRIDRTGPDTASGTCSALMFHAAVPEGTQAPTAPPLVVDYVDAYVRTADGWKFRRRSTRIVFTG